MLRKHTENNRQDNVIDEDQFAMICKALGHPSRIRIMDYLKKMDKCICGSIVDILPQAQSTVSQHLKILKKAGLIKGEVDGQHTCYCLDRRLLEQFKKAVEIL